MLPKYEDVRDLIPREPNWFDGNGVPRYAPFHPSMLGVYDKFAIFAEIGCQGCSNLFLVGLGWPQASFYWGQPMPTLHNIEDLAEDFTYGDPPRHFGCVGETMSSDTL